MRDTTPAQGPPPHHRNRCECTLPRIRCARILKAADSPKLLVLREHDKVVGGGPAPRLRLVFWVKNNVLAG